MTESLQGDHLIEGALQRSFSRGTIVTKNIINQGVIQDFKIGQAVHKLAEVVVHMFQEARIHFHLPHQHRLHVIVDLVPGGNFAMALGEEGVGWHHTESFLPLQGFLAELIPALIKFALVFVGPLGWYVMRGMGGAGGPVDEKGLIGR